MARKRPTMRDALLLAVCEAPDDDAPRLVFADWLTDNGDEAERAWGEFIRLECEWEKLPADDPRRPAVGTRSAELWNRYSRFWSEYLPRGVSDIHGFERGFPEQLCCSARRFLQLGKRLFEITPVRRLDLTNVKGHVDAVLACEILSRLRGLLVSLVTGQDVVKIAACPHLANLTELHLCSPGISEAGVLALAGSPGLTKLTRLSLTIRRGVSAPAREELTKRFREQLGEGLVVF
jgi:uncharacterized protein (TIGR02996 family)